MECWNTGRMEQCVSRIMQKDTGMMEYWNNDSF